jgi:thiamine kinase-like enzyme
MNEKQHSGNSSTRYIVIENTRIFRKIFAPYRAEFYFNEILANEFLYKLNTSLVAKILKKDDSNYSIDYVAYQEAKFTEENASQYLKKIASIHKAIRENNKKYQQMANEPFIVKSGFSVSFLSRIKKMKMSNNCMNSKVKEHIESIELLHLKLMTYLSGIKHSSSLVFSHADSGLHNCLITPKKRILIADLEYAGLDSPIKQCYDFILHPKTQTYSGFFPKWHQYFKEEVISQKDENHLKVYSSLFALKWSLIMLNEYINKIWELRVLSDPSRERRKGEILEAQYNKSILYSKAARQLIDGINPIKLFTKSERDFLSNPY